MRIENDIKLGFKDVMIRPKRSTLKSRSQVSLTRKFNFLHSDITWEGIPIMAANMDTIGTFEMAKALGKEKLFTTIHKHYSPDQWKKFIQQDEEDIKNFIAVSTGTSQKDLEKLKTIISQSSTLKFICIDVANGYSEHFCSSSKELEINIQIKLSLPEM